MDINPDEARKVGELLLKLSAERPGWTILRKDGCLLIAARGEAAKSLDQLLKDNGLTIGE